MEEIHRAVAEGENERAGPRGSDKRELSGADAVHEEKSKDLKLSTVGSPNVTVPNAVAVLADMDAVATRTIERRIADNGTATIEELIDLSLERGSTSRPVR